MIKLTATSLVHSISPVIQVTERFQKRELVLNDSWEKDGDVHHSFVLIEFSGDKMAQLDNFAPGQRVTVECVVNGREYQGRIYNTIKGLKIEPYQQQQPGQYSQSAPAPTYPQPSQYPQQPQYPQGGGYAPMPGYPSQPAQSYTQQPQYPSAPAPASQPQGYPQQSGPGVRQLPFEHK